MTIYYQVISGERQLDDEAAGAIRPHYERRMARLISKAGPYLELIAAAIIILAVIYAFLQQSSAYR